MERPLSSRKKRLFGCSGYVTVKTKANGFILVLKWVILEMNYSGVGIFNCCVATPSGGLPPKNATGITFL